MISIYKLKPAFQKLLQPILHFLHKNGVTANQITIASILLSLIIGVCFWYANQLTFLFLILPIGLLIRMALNALDGMMARTYGQQSKKGEVLNEVGDVISDIFIFFPLLKFESQYVYLIATFLCLSIINEFVGILGKAVSNERRYEGPMGKSDRAFVISVYGIVSYFGISFDSYKWYIFSVIILLLLISTFVRIKKTLTHG